MTPIEPIGPDLPDDHPECDAPTVDPARHRQIVEGLRDAPSPFGSFEPPAPSRRDHVVMRLLEGSTEPAPRPLPRPLSEGPMETPGEDLVGWLKHPASSEPFRPEGGVRFRGRPFVRAERPGNPLTDLAPGSAMGSPPPPEIANLLAEYEAERRRMQAQFPNVTIAATRQLIAKVLDLDLRLSQAIREFIETYSERLTEILAQYFDEMAKLRQAISEAQVEGRTDEAKALYGALVGLTQTTLLIAEKALAVVSTHNVTQQALAARKSHLQALDEVQAEAQSFTIDRMAHRGAVKTILARAQAFTLPALRHRVSFRGAALPNGGQLVLNNLLQSFRVPQQLAVAIFECGFRFEGDEVAPDATSIMSMTGTQVGAAEHQGHQLESWSLLLREVSRGNSLTPEAISEIQGLVNKSLNVEHSSLSHRTTVT